MANLSACALIEDRSRPVTYYGPREQFFASFEEVWRAVNLVLQPYPLRISDMDQGLLETDLIRGYKIRAPVYKNDSVSSGESYHLTIHVVKGALEHRAATKVTIVKDTEVQVDFFWIPRICPAMASRKNPSFIESAVKFRSSAASPKRKRNKTKSRHTTTKIPSAFPLSVSKFLRHLSGPTNFGGEPRGEHQRYRF